MRIPFLVLLSVIACIAAAVSSHAQTAVAVPPEANVEPAPLPSTDGLLQTTTEPALPQADANASPAASAAPIEQTDNATGATPRRFHYELRFGARAVYDDNINISAGGKTSDTYFALEPAILLGVGDVTERTENFIGAEYTPTFQRYVDHSEADSEQHIIHLLGQYRAGRLTLNLSEDMQLLHNANIVANSAIDQVNRDTGTRTTVDTYNTRLSASYYVAGKTFLSSEAVLSVYDYDHLISSESYSGDLFLNYDYSEKLTVGLGGGAGYNTVDDPSPDQTFEQLRGRMTFHPSGKVSMNGSLGAEFRQFNDSSRGTHVSPVFDLQVSYQPFDGTTVDLTASRQTMNSASLGSEDFSSTLFALTLRQRLLQRVQLGLLIGYENADYFSATNDVAVASDRSDNYYSVQPSIDVTVTRFWTIGAYYLHRRSDSSLETISFDNNQVGFRTSLKF